MTISPVVLMKNLLVTIFLISAMLVAAATEEYSTSVHFNTAQHVLVANEATGLDRFLGELPLSGDFEFIVEGHTDIRGGSEYNDALSLSRATTIQHALIDRGIDAARIVVQHFGERNPLAVQATDDSNKQNRRVDITFRHYNFSTISELEAAFMPQFTNVFSVDPTKATVVQGKQGMQLAIPANALVDATGNRVTGPVSLELIEAPGLTSFMGAGLATQAGKSLLESGGMLKVSATADDGTPVFLDPEKSMVVSVPSEQRKEGMELFLSGDGSNWNATAVPLTAGANELPTLDAGMEKFPAFRGPTFRPPAFQRNDSLKAGPKPVKPFKPTRPALPRKEAFEANFSWYQLLNRSKVRAEGEARFARALDSYDKRMERYEKYHQRYVVDSTQFAAEMQAYTEQVERWRKDVECQKDYHKHTEAYHEAFEVHEQHWIRARAAFDKKADAWRQERFAQMETVATQMDSMGLASAEMVNNYVFAVNTFGWINCDRFIGMPEQDKTILAVHDADTIPERVMVVFTNIKSVLRLADCTGVYRSVGFPRYEPAVVLAYRVVDGGAEMSYHDVADGFESDLDFKPTSFAELRATLAKLQTQQDGNETAALAR